MNIRNIINFEDFCGITYIKYTYRYMDKQSEEYNYYQVRMPVELLELLYDRISSIDPTITIFPNPDKGTSMIISYDVNGVTEERNVRAPVNLIPTLDFILNSEVPVFIENGYNQSNGCNVDLPVLLITNKIQSVSSFGDFDSKVFTVIDVRRMENDKWEKIFVYNIDSVVYSQDKIIIKMKQPIITMLWEV